MGVLAVWIKCANSRCSADVPWADKQMHELCILFFTSAVEIPPYGHLGIQAQITADGVFRGHFGTKH